MAAPAQAPRQAEPMRGTVTSGLPRAFTTPTTQSAWATRHHCLPGRRHSIVCPLKTTTRDTERRLLGDRQPGPSGGGGFTSSNRVAHAWPEGPFILTDRGPFCVLFSRLVLRQNQLHPHCIGTDVDTLVLGDRCPLYVSMGRGLKGAPCATDRGPAVCPTLPTGLGSHLRGSTPPLH